MAPTITILDKFKIIRKARSTYVDHEEIRDMLKNVLGFIEQMNALVTIV